MPYRLEGQGSDKTTRCAVCGGKFGLIRHYSWGTQLCSGKCVDRFRARRQSYGNWMGLAPNHLGRVAGKRPGCLITIQISQRGNKYLKDAPTLLRTAKIMTDPAIAG